MTDLELLIIEAAAIWGLDQPVAVDPHPELVIAQNTGGQVALPSDRVAPAVAQTLIDLVAQSPSVSDAAAEPSALHACTDLLSALGEVEVAAGPSFLIERVPTTRATGKVRRSDSGEQDDLRALRPESAWEADEWNELLVGNLGPWAMIIDDDQVAAICHTARLTTDAVEAGVWTHPVHRRRGHGAAVAAAWSATVAGLGRSVFYSTSADNLASRKIAASLGLRPIGWLWKLRVRPRGA